MREKTFPRTFRCNRDEWADAEGEIHLECDLVPKFLSQSFTDFIAMILMPYLLVLVTWFGVTLLVYEKEAGLRHMMKVMGLGSFSYWLINYVMYVIQYVVLCVVMVLMNGVAGMRFFTIHSGFVVWSFLLVWGNVAVAMSCLLSLFFKSTRTASAVTLLFLYCCIEVGGQVIGNMIGSEFSEESSYTPLMLLPPLVMLRILYWLLPVKLLQNTISD